MKMASRTPLGDATDRVLNAPSDRPYKATRGRTTERNPLRVQTTTTTASTSAHPPPHQRASHKPNSAHRGQPASPIAALVNEGPGAGNRDSQLSGSSASSGKRKTHIGPWQLGKTLGKGSAARVRLARHNVSHELAAVKILSQASCHMTQAGSLAELDKWDRSREEYATENHIPLSIEREVAILKLIDHPNIMKLYDIWENRAEIYLVLEFVERGDLFEYINSHGPIAEDETIFYFRQMLSALEYCHSFNICHRDLKPENILLKENGQIKIADFGMAAIQQSPNHMLRTSCGSPHYAAPELVSRKKYRGDKVDVWSLGVILYAMLCARLPFDDPDIPRLLAKATKGIYEMPSWLSANAQDLIRKMLQVDPKDRISTRRIWKHPLVLKYAHFDRFDENGGQPHSIPKSGECRPVKPEELDMQTLRQLKSMWHTFSEKYLQMKLIGPEPNDQKLFYWLLHSYREKQLENYDSALTHSTSDFHHLRPKNWKTKYTTLEFPSQGGRTPSRFTVISNVATDAGGEVLETATDGGGTIVSYDPYKSSRVLGHDAEASHAKITVYRNASMARSSTKSAQLDSIRGESVRTASAQSKSARLGNVMASGTSASRRSLASIRSTDSPTYKRPATSRYKRGVDFSHARRRSIPKTDVSKTQNNSKIANQGQAARLISISSVQPEKVINRNTATASGPRPEVDAPSDHEPVPWKDELLHLSSSIARDCDDAFNSSLLLPQPSPGHLTVSRDHSESMMSTTIPSPRQPAASHPWDSRPLPPPPPTKHASTPGSNEVSGPPKRSARDGNAEPADMRISNAITTASHDQRRVVSAPIYAQYSTQKGAGNLHSILETPREEKQADEHDKTRIVSAPADCSTPHRERRGLEYLAQHENTIRVVTSPSARTQQPKSMVPLNVRKKTSRGANTPARYRQNQPAHKLVPTVSQVSVLEDEPSFISRNSSTTSRKKTSWFKRGSRDPSLDKHVSNSDHPKGPRIVRVDSSSSSGPASALGRKKGFNFAFWRQGRDEPLMRLSIEDFDLDEPISTETTQNFDFTPTAIQHMRAKDEGLTRHIAPQQSWLARLFRVKPATRYLCFTIPRRRARQEIANLLRDWRKYGIRDIEVDKERNIVFARVGAKNYLNIKGVSFAAEIMTVIEHGKRSHLCIVRLTQEKGAASSFHRVVDTMNTVFDSRNLLVAESRKAKMMIKTLNS